MTDRFGEESFEVPNEIWTYRARPDHYSTHELGVVDGDTYDIEIDQGFFDRFAPRVRAPNIDTAETYGTSKDSEEYRIGAEQTRFVREWIEDAIEHAEQADDVPADWPLLIRTEHESGGFERWLAEIFNWRGKSLEADLIDEYGEEYLWE